MRRSTRRCSLDIWNDSALSLIVYAGQQVLSISGLYKNAPDLLHPRSSKSLKEQIWLALEVTRAHPEYIG